DIPWAPVCGIEALPSARPDLPKVLRCSRPHPLRAPRWRQIQAATSFSIRKRPRTRILWNRASCALLRADRHRYWGGLRHAIDQRSRWIIGQEALGQLSRDEAGGGRMVGHKVEHLFPIFNSTAGGDLHAEDGFLALVVHTRVEAERTAGPWPVNRPAGETASHLGHIVLCIAAVDAERVEFQQFAAVVFI